MEYQTAESLSIKKKNLIEHQGGRLNIWGVARPAATQHGIILAPSSDGARSATEAPCVVSSVSASG